MSEEDGSIDVDLSDDAGSTGGRVTFTREQQAEVNRIAAKARAEGAKERTSSSKGEPSLRERVDVMEKLTAALASQAAPKPKPDPATSGPAAPNGNYGTPVNPVTAGGMVDLFNLSVDQLDQLGPSGMRKLHEQNLAVGRERSGAPPRPASIRNRK